MQLKRCGSAEGSPHSNTTENDACHAPFPDASRHGNQNQPLHRKAHGCPRERTHAHKSHASGLACGTMLFHRQDRRGEDTRQLHTWLIVINRRHPECQVPNCLARSGLFPLQASVSFAYWLSWLSSVDHRLLRFVSRKRILRCTRNIRGSMARSPRAHPELRMA